MYVCQLSAVKCALPFGVVCNMGMAEGLDGRDLCTLAYSRSLSKQVLPRSFNRIRADSVPTIAFLLPEVQTLGLRRPINSAHVSASIEVRHSSIAEKEKVKDLGSIQATIDKSTETRYVHARLVLSCRCHC